MKKATILFASLAVLVGCQTVVTGAGCNAYSEARLALPSDADLLVTPRPVLEWIVIDLDARMTGACT